MGTVYLAEPVCDDIHTSLPLELVVTVFDSEYYSTSQGRKKLKQIESEMLKLINIRHPNLLSVFAVKLMTPHSNHPRLVILMEERPSLCLQDVLEDCDTLKEERASVCYKVVSVMLVTVLAKLGISASNSDRFVCAAYERYHSSWPITPHRLPGEFNDSGSTQSRQAWESWLLGSVA